MNPSAHPIHVELRNPNEPFFCGLVHGVEFHSEVGVTIEMSARSPDYLSLGRTAEVRFRIERNDRRFRLANACASMKGNQLVVLAETVQEIGRNLASREALLLRRIHE
jgi:hypothetical protein